MSFRLRTSKLGTLKNTNCLDILSPLLHLHTKRNTLLWQTFTLVCRHLKITPKSTIKTGAIALEQSNLYILCTMFKTPFLTYYHEHMFHEYSSSLTYHH